MVVFEEAVHLEDLVVGELGIVVEVEPPGHFDDGAPVDGFQLVRVEEVGVFDALGVGGENGLGLVDGGESHGERWLGPGS